MLNRLHIAGVGPAPELDLRLAPRLNLLTGDNGLGKSFVLDVAWWALTRTWAGSPAWPDPARSEAPKIKYLILNPAGGQDSRSSTYRFEDQSWPPPKGRASKPAVVIYARVDGSFSVWDPYRNSSEESSNGSGTLPVDRPPAYHFSPQEVWDGLREESRMLCRGLIEDWVSWQDKDAEAFKQLREVLRVLSPGEMEELRPGKPVRVRLDDVRDIPTMDMPYGSVPVVHASAGMKRILGLAYLLVWAWQEHLRAASLVRRLEADRIVFLIDEIETHLHPKWQRLILPALLSVAEKLKENARVQILTTTHAPLILASVEPVFEEAKDALFTFDLEGDHVEVTRTDWRSRGDASSWLTSDVFDLKEARSLQAERAIQQAMAAMRRPDLPIQEARRIHHELNAVLKDTDPFWARWLVQAKAAGIDP